MFTFDTPMLLLMSFEMQELFIGPTHILSSSFTLALVNPYLGKIGFYAMACVSSFDWSSEIVSFTYEEKLSLRGVTNQQLIGHMFSFN